MTEWLGLMLAEIDRKEAEGRAANEERRRRDAHEGPADDSRSTDVA
jgi:hypothetical protein